MSFIKLFLAGNNYGISEFLDRGRTLLRQEYSQSGTINSLKVEVFLARKSLIKSFNSAVYTDLPQLD
jgi:hypothetical protein